MSRAQKIIFLCLLLFGTLNIVATYPRLSFTADEPTHVASGMEWWQYHTYRYDAVNPPLTRLMAASLLYFSGKDFSVTLGDKIPWAKGIDILHSHKTDKLNLILLRLGVLPFYILSCVFVFIWARKLYGTEPALISLALFATLPMVAAHAGLATTDMGCAATYLLAVVALHSFLVRPDIVRSIAAGLAVGLMLSAKFSAAAYLGAFLILLLFANGLSSSERRLFTFGFRHLWLAATIIAPIGFFVLYLFFFMSWEDLWRGLRDLYQKNRYGHAAWFLGSQHGNSGVWYFFPVLYLFKTPIAFLITNILSFVRIGRDMAAGRPISLVLPLLAAFSVFLVNLFSNINLGLRHALPAYPFLVIAAGYGIWWLWQEKPPFGKYAAMGLIAWQSLVFAGSFPDRISYFNPLAYWLTGNKPEKIIFDSDLEWGQNHYQIAEVFKKYQITGFYNCMWYGGFGRNFRQTLNADAYACPSAPVSGWLILSRGARQLKPEKYQWLSHHEPVEVIAGSYWLYKIP